MDGLYLYGLRGGKINNVRNGVNIKAYFLQKTRKMFD